MGPLHTLKPHKELQNYTLSLQFGDGHITYIYYQLLQHTTKVGIQNQYAKKKKIRKHKHHWMPLCTPNGYFSYQKRRETNVYIANKGKKKRVGGSWRLLLSYGTSPTFN